MSKVIKAVKVNGEIVMVGSDNTSGVNHGTIVKIEVDKFSLSGDDTIIYKGKDEYGETVFEATTRNSIVFFFNKEQPHDKTS